MATTSAHVQRGPDPGTVLLYVENDYGAASGPTVTEVTMTLAQAIVFLGNFTRVVNDAAAMLP